MPELTRIINGPRGPEKILPALTAQELTDLIDALYSNLDTPEPEFGAETWYELAVEEDLRRSSLAGDAVLGAVDHHGAALSFLPLHPQALPVFLTKGPAVTNA